MGPSIRCCSLTLIGSGEEVMGPQKRGKTSFLSLPSQHVGYVMGPTTGYREKLHYLIRTPKEELYTQSPSTPLTEELCTQSPRTPLTEELCTQGPSTPLTGRKNRNFGELKTLKFLNSAAAAGRRLESLILAHVM